MDGEQAGGHTSRRDRFDHERLVAYERAIDFLRLADDLASKQRGHRRALGWDLFRAAVSLVANIGEASGACTSREKARFFRYALRSATESAALLEGARAVGAADQSTAEIGRALLLEIVRTVTGLRRAMKRYGNPK